MLRLLALLSLLLLAACSSKKDIVQPSPLPAFKPAATFERAWHVRISREQAPAGSRLAPAVTGNAVYVADSQGRLLALARGDGRRLWQARTALAVGAGPVAGYNQLLLGTREGELAAFDAGAGELQWKVAVSGEVLAPPALDNELVAVKTAAGRLVAVERATGNQRWSWDNGAPMLALRASGRPLLVADAVLAGLPGGTLVAIGRADGRQLWERRVAEPEGASELDRLVDVAGDLAIGGNYLYAAAWQGRLVGLDLRNGQYVWQQPLSTHRDLAAADGNVFAVDADDHVLAFRGSDGVALWRQQALQGRRLTGAAAVGDYLLVGDFAGYLHLLRRSDGEIVGRRRLDRAGIVTTPVVDDGMVFVQGRSGHVAAYRIE